MLELLKTSYFTVEICCKLNFQFFKTQKAVQTCLLLMLITLIKVIRVAGFKVWTWKDWL